MLRLTRRAGESIYIGDDVKVTIESRKGKDITLQIEAPKHIEVDRAEVRAAKNRSRLNKP